MKTTIRIAVCTAIAAALFIAGYSAGLLVQHKRDVHRTAALDLDRAVLFHKTLAVGNYDRAFHETLTLLMVSATQLDRDAEPGELPYLWRESLSGRDDAGYRRAALARAISLRRARPDIGFPREIRPAMDSFVPQTECEKKGLIWYSWWNPAGA